MSQGRQCIIYRQPCIQYHSVYGDEFMNGMRKKRLDLSLLSKALFMCYVLYTYVLNYALFYIPFFSFALLISALLFQLKKDSFRIRLDVSMFALMVFIIYLLATGVFVSSDFNQVTKSVVSLMEYVIVFYLIICYSKADNKPDFPPDFQSLRLRA